MIPAGTVHAIGAGVLLAEIQQMSDATFRMHDWGRVGPDGNPRTLHKEQSLAATDFRAGPVNPIIAQTEAIEGGERERLVHCQYFVLERLRLRAPTCVGSADRFTILLGLEGDSEVRYSGESFPLGFGHTLLLPAMLGEVQVAPAGATATLLTCVVPDAA
jgi:mannose-6-phosphate isomerase